MRPPFAPRLSRGEHRSSVPRLAICLALLLAPPAVFAAPSLAFDEALARAIGSAPALQAREAGLTAARETAAQADQLPDPQLILGIDNLPVGASPFDTGDSEMTMKKVGLMQAFPAFAKRRARREVADRLVDRAQALSAIERLQVREQVARAWLDAWVAGREVGVLRALRRQAGVAVEVAEARLKGGTAAATEAMAAEAAALEVDNRIRAAEAAQAAARASLAGWLGVEPGALPEVGDAPDLASLPVPEAVLLATVDEQRRLLEARAGEAVAQARVDEAIADRRPDWSLMAAYGQRDGGRDDMLMVEARIDLPLFAPRRQDRLVAARRADLEAATAERQEAERAQREAVRRALAEWHGLQAQVALHERRILPLASDRTKAALAAYGAGAPIQPWLDAERDELEAHLMHVRHLGEVARLWASLAYLLPEETSR